METVLNLLQKIPQLPFSFVNLLIHSPLAMFFFLVFVNAVIFFALVALKKVPRLRFITRFSASLTLAVLIIVAIGVISAVGTVVESKYNLQTAQRAVYQTWWMWGALIALCVNLTGVMADRWPWKWRHSSFVMAHIGINLTMIGSVLTYVHGVDGSMRLAINQKSAFVTLPPTDLLVWSSFDGESYVKVFEENVNFFKNPPDREPLTIPLPDAEIQVLEHYPFALGSSKIKEDKGSRGGPAIRFQIDNPHVSVNHWIFARRGPTEQDFGPARVLLAREPQQPSGRNEIILYPKSKEKIAYAIHSSRGDEPILGEAEQGDVIETGWMGLKFRLLRYFQNADEVWTYEERPRPTQMTTEAVRLKFADTEYWLGLNSIVKMFTDRAVYLVSYGNRRLNLGVPIELKKFTVGRYQGTMRAATYESDVFVEGLGDIKISMNEPLKHKGYTFYQASFEENEQGQPTHSILSVNFDPGRGLKYAGSLLIVLGSTLLFWRKKLKKKK